MEFFQRTLKFRAWDIELEFMHKDSQYHAMCVDKDGLLKYKALIFIQYTGCVDSEKEEIFEGDLIKIEGDDAVYFVEYAGSGFELVCVTRENPKYDDDVNHEYGISHSLSVSQMRWSSKIIGNIYENQNYIKES